MSRAIAPHILRISSQSEAQFGPTENGPIAMTWQSLSRLAQSPKASLTAFCSLAAFNASPGRPDAPTATAFHPEVASASLRVASSRASAAIDELRAGRKKPVTLNVVGMGTTKKSSSATIRQATPARAPHDSRFRRAEVFRGFDADIIEELPARADRDRLGLPARRIIAFEPRSSGVAHKRHILGCERFFDRRITPDPGLRRQWRLAMRIDNCAAERIDLAFAR